MPDLDSIKRMPGAMTTVRSQTAYLSRSFPLAFFIGRVTAGAVLGAGTQRGGRSSGRHLAVRFIGRTKRLYARTAGLHRQLRCILRWRLQRGLVQRLLS